MKIVQLECWKYSLKLSEPYTIAYETISDCTNVFLKLTTDNGISGFGCAAPDFYITKEDEQTVLGAFQEYIEPTLKGQDPFHYYRLLEMLRHNIRQHPSARAMTDMALYDLVAKQAKVPLYKYLGGYRDSIPTSITVGILPVNETVEKSVDFIHQGFKILKIKGGSNLDEDIERMIKVREAIGEEILLRFDANQGYNVKESIKFIEKTRAVDIELFEQPTDKQNDELLGKVSAGVLVPVMADESLMTLKDVFRLAKNDFTDMINIKLMKVGGISEALQINSVAKAAGFESMIGCMDESELGIAAGLNLALSRPNIQYADLDGHLDLIDDPFAGIMKLKDGVLHPGDSPGLGVKENLL
jgi:L-alanine-DL-glutamate epimerase-like enolase superfamily enzyme